MPLKRNPSTRRTECNICIDAFVRPRMLPCGHSFCETCLKGYLEKKASESRRVVGTVVTCPVCRKQLTVVDKSKPIEEWTELFPLNHLGITLLDEQIEEEKLTTCETHIAKFIQFFCVDHNKLACSKCLKETHRACNIYDLDEDGMRECADAVLGKLNKTKEKLSYHIQQLNDEIDNISQKTRTITDHVKMFRAEIEQMLRTLEDKITQTANQLCSTDISRLDKERQNCRQCVHEIETSISSINFQMVSHSVIEVMRVFQKDEDNLKSTKAKLSDFEKTSLLVNYEWNTDIELSALKQSLVNLIDTPIVRSETPAVGSGENEENDSNDVEESKLETSEHSIPPESLESRESSVGSVTSPSLSHSTEQPLWFRTADHVANIETEKHNTCSQSCDITASAILKDHRIVLADCNNNCIMIFSIEDTIFTHIKDIRCSNRPWGITNFTDNDTKLAITFPYVRYIMLLDVDGVMATKIGTQRKCYGIVSYRDTLITTTFDDGHFVIFFDLTGNTLRVIELRKVGNINVLKPISVAVGEHKDLIYVACCGDKGSDGCLVTMDTYGKLNDIFTDTDLRQYYSCAVDREGNVYVCGNASSTVTVVSSSNDARKTLLTKQSGVYKPCHISFFPNGDSFLLADMSSAVKMFKLMTL